MITANDFRIAGGLILLVLAVLDLLILASWPSTRTRWWAVVPLGMPLIAGPATPTSVLVLSSEFGRGMTALSLPRIDPAGRPRGRCCTLLVGSNTPAPRKRW